MPQPPKLSDREVARQAAEHARKRTAEKEHERAREADRLAAERRVDNNGAAYTRLRAEVELADINQREQAQQIQLRPESQEIRDFATQRLDAAVHDAAALRARDGFGGVDSIRQYRERVQQVAEWSRVVRDLPKPSEMARVKSEPLTYRADNATQISYFRDLIHAQAGGGSAEGQQALKRLEQHAREMRSAMPQRDAEARAHGRTGGARFETRVNPNRTPGKGGYFAPPIWLFDEAATAPRAGRVLSALIDVLPLPGGVSSVNLPRITTGTIAQQAADGAATPSQDIVDAASTSPVMPIVGHSDAALQLLEQSPPNASFDVAVFMDLESAYVAQLEAYLLAGSGQNGQVLGITLANDASTDVTYTDATPTAAEMAPYFAKMAGRIGRTRKAPPEAWLLTSARWSWLSVAGLPASTLTIGDGGHDDGRVGNLLGWPAYPDDAIPETLGASGTEDLVIACKPSDLRLWESDPIVQIDRESLSGVLGARLTLHRNVAFIADRQPAGLAVLSGSGLIFPVSDR